ncbi:MAG: hypothetical protein VYE15_06465 [Myxococcota bacterium]|nr:hypothetical protein [Myxococcota bacterium]
MSEENQDLGTELESLFDATAHTPDVHRLTRMAARAQDVPSTSKAAPWPTWIWTATVVLAAMIATGVWFPQGGDGSRDVPPTSESSTPLAETPASTGEVDEPHVPLAKLDPSTQNEATVSDPTEEADLPYAVIFDIGWGLDDEEDFHLAGGSYDDLSTDELFATYDEVLAQDG